MTIREVCDKYGITADTLRYYEKAGVIPAVNRTGGGVRDYTPEDERWVESAVFMRSAGVPVEMVAEYVKLFQQGDGTFQARRDLLCEVRSGIQEKLEMYQNALDRLNYKISRYEEAVKTGVLSWDSDKHEVKEVTGHE